MRAPYGEHEGPPRRARGAPTAAGRAAAPAGTARKEAGRQREQRRGRIREQTAPWRPQRASSRSLGALPPPSRPPGFHTPAMSPPGVRPRDASLEIKHLRRENIAPLTVKENATPALPDRSLRLSSGLCSDGDLLCGQWPKEGRETECGRWETGRRSSTPEGPEAHRWPGEGAWAQVLPPSSLQKRQAVCGPRGDPVCSLVRGDAEAKDPAEPGLGPQKLISARCFKSLLCFGLIFYTSIHK